MRFIQESPSNRVWRFLAVLAAIGNPDQSAPLTAAEQEAVLECISNPIIFKQRCYTSRGEEFRRHVIRAVSLVGEKDYLLEEDGRSYRQLFKDMVLEHDHDTSFVYFINFLDSLVLRGLLTHQQLSEIVYSDTNNFIASWSK